MLFAQERMREREDVKRTLLIIVALFALCFVAWLLLSRGGDAGPAAPTARPAAADRPAPATAAVVDAPAPAVLRTATRAPSPRLFDVAPAPGDTAPPCALDGRVVAEGRPVAGVAVTLRRQEEWTTVARASVTTGAGGAFSFGDVRHAWYRVSVEQDGWLPATKAWRCDDGAPRTLELELERGDARIHGRVTDEAGGPIADVDVTVQEVGSANHFRVATYVGVDDDGRFQLTVAGGAPEGGGPKYRVYATAPGYGFKDLDCSPAVGDDVTLAFMLPREGWVEGVVTTSDGAPAAGADVFQKGKGALVGTRTDAEGKFAMAMRPGFPLDVVARLHGETGRAALSPLSKGESRLGVTVALAPGRTVSGHVEGTSDVGGLAVLVTEVGLGGVVVPTTTDDAGRFSVDGMPAVSLRAILRAPAVGVAVIDDE